MVGACCPHLNLPTNMIATHPTRINITCTRLDEDFSSYERVYLYWEEAGEIVHSERDDDFIHHEFQDGIVGVFANDVKVLYRLDPESVCGDPCDGYSSASFIRA